MGKDVNPFRLRKACVDCPFRTDRPAYITPERAAGIAESLHRGNAFNCHKTLDYGNVGEPYADPYRTQVCVGSIVASAGTHPDGPDSAPVESQVLQVWDRLYGMRPDLDDDPGPLDKSLLDFVSRVSADAVDLHRYGTRSP